MSRILFIGGPGNISTSALELVLERGHEAAVFTLPDTPTLGFEKRVKFYFGDRNKPEEIRKAVEEFKPALTADFCCFAPAQAEGLAEVLRNRVEKHLFVSTVDVYGYPPKRVPLREDDPWSPTISQYATDKLACERIFGAEYNRGALPLAIARPSYSFGPAFVLNFFSRQGGLELLSRLRAGKPVVVPGDGQTFVHPCSAYNTGRMIAETLLEPATVGHGFTCAHPSFMTADEYYRLFARALGVEAKLVHVPKDLLLPLEMGIIPDNLLSELTGYHVAFSVEKFRSFFPEFAWTKSLDQAAREYVEYHDSRGNIPKEGQGYDDRLIAAWEAARQAFRP